MADVGAFSDRGEMVLWPLKLFVLLELTLLVYSSPEALFEKCPPHERCGSNPCLAG